MTSNQSCGLQPWGAGRSPPPSELVSLSVDGAILVWGGVKRTLQMSCPVN